MNKHNLKKSFVSARRKARKTSLKIQFLRLKWFRDERFMMDNKPEGDLPIFLVADDERQIGMMHREYCRMYFPGSEFVFVQDGLEAFEMLQTRRFDVLITDHQMPGITGIDLLKRLKEIDLKIFKAVFSGSGAVERVYEAYQILGADIVLPKPDVRNFWISLKEKLQ